MADILNLPVVASSGGGGGSTYEGQGSDTFDPTTSRITFFEDYATNILGTTAGGTSGWYFYGSGTGATSQEHAPAIADINRIGQWQFGSGSSANSYAGIAGNRGAFLPGDCEFTAAFSFQLQALPDATDDYRIRAGFGNASGAAAPTWAIAFIIDRTVSTTNWVAHVRDNASVTNTDTGIAISTNWVNLRLTVNSDGTSVEFFIDGVSVATITTNIPTSLAKDMGVQWIQTQVAGAAQVTYHDWMLLDYKPTTQRGTF